MVHHPAGGAHHDLHTALEAGDLVAEVGAAVHRQHPQLRHLRRVAVERIGHLNGQLAGGGEHQHLRCALGWIQASQQGQREGGRLAGAGLRLAHEVAAQQQLRDGGLLNR